MNDTDPIQFLMDEHDIINSCEDVITKIDGLWEKDPRLYDDTVRSLLKFFQEYGDKFHHHKEEEVLFSEMTSHLDFQQHEIIAELEEHHQMFRDYLEEVEVAIDLREWQNAQNVLTKYINHLLDHIAAENDEVYMMAQTLFSESELERMYFRFQDIDSELGLDKKSELVEMLDKLKTP